MEDLYICHGAVEHSYLDRHMCEYCKGVDEEFEKVIQNAGGLENLTEYLEKKHTLL